ncbi:hypothetical protein PGT21_017077 [Puccinia graminis f. sp. tritici]|uniref:Uncharacterized protein n=1 Tax=Puccinia graminis f. sp. tritici TaxID=56615 RepID=A0A5B0MU14_PUCGR|nr:hypothetical protein PGT21_017077 [Puccinia graminis f. sp. tritici]
MLTTFYCDAVRLHLSGFHELVARENPSPANHGARMGGEKASSATGYKMSFTGEASPSSNGYTVNGQDPGRAAARVTNRQGLHRGTLAEHVPLGVENSRLGWRKDPLAEIHAVDESA